MARSGTNSPFARDLPSIRVLGTMVFDPIWAEKEHPASGCELLHVIRGAVTLHLNGHRYHAEAGGSLLVPPGARHRDEFDLKSGLEVLYCSFEWRPWKAYFQKVNNETLQQVGPRGRTELSALFDQLRADLAGTGPADRLLAQSRLLTVLLLLLREAGRGTARSGEETESFGLVRRRELVRRAKEYLARNYARCVALDEIAAALDVSAYHLSHIFSAESDFSLFSYLTNLRIEKACVLLREGRLNVSEIARAVGYGDANYFAKVFRRQTGQSPRQFAARRMKRNA
jgi:AraC-like DNA-binding protein